MYKNIILFFVYLISHFLRIVFFCNSSVTLLWFQCLLKISLLDSLDCWIGLIYTSFKNIVYFASVHHEYNTVNVYRLVNDLLAFAHFRIILLNKWHLLVCLHSEAYLLTERKENCRLIVVISLSITVWLNFHIINSNLTFFIENVKKRSQWKRKLCFVILSKNSFCKLQSVLSYRSLC